MRFLVEDLKIATGGPNIVIMNDQDAECLDLHNGDRVNIRNRRRLVIAKVDISSGDSFIRKGTLGLVKETFLELGVKNRQPVELSLETKPESLKFIRKKLEGETLSRREIDAIIRDIVSNRLDDIETTYFVAACSTRLMTTQETVDLTKAMIKFGERLTFKRKPVIDKHCVGGVAGNRTTPIIVAIVASHGLLIPKTSSRSITSPAGTADTMEVITSVAFPIRKIRRVIRKTNACLVWGGAINLAPADDRIIRVEHPLSIDSRSQLIASILAKKASVSATHVLVDIPSGKGSKIENIHKALSLKRQFETIGRRIGMTIRCIITDGSTPIGNGFGPILEAKDVLHVLRGDGCAPLDLKDKSVMMAGRILEMAGKASKGKGFRLAMQTLESGQAWKKFKEIVEAQGKKELDPEKQPGKFTLHVRSPKAGRIDIINNENISKIARIAGAPRDAGAGILLHKHKNETVKRGDLIYTIYTNNRQRLGFARDFAKKHASFIVH
ncbi:MAG: AMP phosphorylase [DPANN group archaeon]|nr:AMP phosphorylase [DPANN group archaeon]